MEATEVLALGLRVTPPWRLVDQRLGRVGWQFTLALAAYDLIRPPKLMAASA